MLDGRGILLSMRGNFLQAYWRISRKIDEYGQEKTRSAGVSCDEYRF